MRRKKRIESPRANERVRTDSPIRSNKYCVNINKHRVARSYTSQHICIGSSWGKGVREEAKWPVVRMMDGWCTERQVLRSFSSSLTLLTALYSSLISQARRHSPLDSTTPMASLNDSSVRLILSWRPLRTHSFILYIQLFLDSNCHIFISSCVQKTESNHLSVKIAYRLALE